MSLIGPACHELLIVYEPKMKRRYN